MRHGRTSKALGRSARRRRPCGRRARSTRCPSRPRATRASTSTRSPWSRSGARSPTRTSPRWAPQHRLPGRRPPTSRSAPRPKPRWNACCGNGTGSPSWRSPSGWPSCARIAREGGGGEWAAGQAAAWEVLRTLVSPRVRFDVWGGGFRFLPWPGFEHRVPHVGSELRRGAAQQVAADRVQARHLHVRHRRGRQHLPAAVPHGRPGGHVEREANASTSNPLIFPNWSSTWDTVSGISLAAWALEVHGLEGAG